MLSIEHFSYTYAGRKRPAVDDLTLRVEAGDIFGFIGHNGAGKTTTIRALTGVLAFDQGDIFLGGRSIKEEPLACKRMLSYVPDNPDLYDFMTGSQYVHFICDVFEMDGAARGGIQRLSDIFGITENLNDLIASYSHGMKQKLALVAAFVHEPQVMVFDEPFVGLDPKAVHSVKELMKARCAAGCAVFFSTHVLEVAEKLCNKIAIIKDGRLAACGPTDAVRGDQSLEDVFLELIEDA